MTDGGDRQTGVSPALTASQLIATVPGLAESGVSVEVRDVRQLPGASLAFDDVLELAAAIDERIAKGASGVVVTQGTDTIEETAYVLDLMYGGNAPIVVTGAMRNPTLAGADGPVNLLAAIRVAASPRARGLGCVVVFGDEIHAARYVRKIHTSRTEAFASPNVGAIGHLVEGEVCMLVLLERRAPLHISRSARPVRVALITIAFGDDGELLRSIDDRFDGAVIAAFGVGHVPAAAVPVLTNLAARIPVVLASRTGSGSIFSRTYGFPGSEQDLLRRGLISAGFLDPFKARVFLHLLIASEASREEIADAFEGEGARQRRRSDVRVGSE